MGNGETIMSDEVKLMHVITPFELGKANGICDTPGSSVGSGGNLKCLYTNTNGMRNKWDELEICSFPEL